MTARLARLLDPELGRSGAQGGLSWLNRLILGVIVASIVMGILETEPVLRETLGPVFAASEIVFLVLFGLEYLARLAVARHNPRYGSAWRYAMTPAAIVDLAVIVLIVLPFLGLESTILRLLRALRILRLARLGRYSQALRILGEAIASRGPEVMVSLVFAGGLLLFSSACLYVIEGGSQPDAFGSIPRAMWWSVATLTTVGYGDVVPVTAAGRVFAALTALTGVGIIAVPTGLLAGAFTEAFQRARNQRAGAGAGAGAGTRVATGAGVGAGMPETGETGAARDAAEREGRDGPQA